MVGSTLLRHSDGKQIGVSEVARRHVEEDFGGHVPAVSRCFRRATLEGWMQEARGFPTDVLAARRFGGVSADYQEIRNWFERAEGRCPDGRARLLLTHTFGIFCANRGSDRCSPEPQMASPCQRDQSRRLTCYESSAAEFPPPATSSKSYRWRRGWAHAPGHSLKSSARH